MSGLLDVPFTAVQHHEGATNFYYGVHPYHIQSLPAYAEFSVVYSPKDGDDWQFVTYRMFPNASGIAVTARRDLTAEEITYFEEQTLLTKHDTGTTPIIGDSPV